MGQDGGGGSGKICFFCGDDCAGQPRGKDPQGRYFHKRCLEEAKAEVADGRFSSDMDLVGPGGAAAAAARPAPTPRPRPSDAPPTSPDDGYSLLGGLLDDAGDAAEAPPVVGAACSSCGAPMAVGAVLCTSCGYNAATGSKLKSKMKRVKSDGGGGAAALSGAGVLLNPWIIFLAIALLFGALFMIAQTGDAGLWGYMLVFAGYSLILGITTIVFAFKDHGIAYGIFSIVCGIFTILYGLLVAEPRWLRAGWGGYLVGLACYFVLIPNWMDLQQRLEDMENAANSDYYYIDEF